MQACCRNDDNEGTNDSRIFFRTNSRTLGASVRTLARSLPRFNHLLTWPSSAQAKSRSTARGHSPSCGPSCSHISRKECGLLS